MTFDRKVTKWKAVVYHLKGQALQARDEQLHLSKNTIFWVPSVAKIKKNYRANLTSSINDSQHDQKESESSNVRSSGSLPRGSSRVPCVNAENPRPAAPPGTARLARVTGDGPFAHGQRPSRVSRVSGVRCSRYPVCGLVWERGSQAGASRWGRMGRPPGEGPGHPQPFTLSPGPRRLDWRAGLFVDMVRVMRARVQRSERGLGAEWPQRPPHLPGQAAGCPAQLPVTRPSLAVFPLPSQGWARAVSPPRCV